MSPRGVENLAPIVRRTGESLIFFSLHDRIEVYPCLVIIAAKQVHKTAIQPCRFVSGMPIDHPVQFAQRLSMITLQGICQAVATCTPIDPLAIVQYRCRILEWLEDTPRVPSGTGPVGNVPSSAVGRRLWRVRILRWRLPEVSCRLTSAVYPTDLGVGSKSRYDAIHLGGSDHALFQGLADPRPLFRTFSASTRRPIRASHSARSRKKLRVGVVNPFA